MASGHAFQCSVIFLYFFAYWCWFSVLSDCNFGIWRSLDGGLSSEELRSNFEQHKDRRCLIRTLDSQKVCERVLNRDLLGPCRKFITCNDNGAVNSNIGEKKFNIMLCSATIRYFGGGVCEISDVVWISNFAQPCICIQRDIPFCMGYKRRKFMYSKCPYASAGISAFNPVISSTLIQCGDIEAHPGPIQGKSTISQRLKCLECSKTLAKNHRCLCCGLCNQTIHIKCAGIKQKEYILIRNEGKQWTCKTCSAKELMQSLPFYPTPGYDTDFQDPDSGKDADFMESDGNCDVWADFDNIKVKYSKNLKIGHLNANSIAGFKFYEIKCWLESGKFDILFISETKLDATFPNDQFAIRGFRMSRVDRNIHGGGIMAFVRSDICFAMIKDFKHLYIGDKSNFTTETLALKVKVAKSWLIIVGVYRPPSMRKSQWKLELNTLFEIGTTLSDDIIFIGDFNCDLLQPDKPPKDGRDLLDLLDIYDLKNLIETPTRISKTSETLIDLILTRNRRKILISGVVDVNVSDHSLVYTVLRAHAPKLRSRKICFRSMKCFNRYLFQKDLCNIPFQIMDIFDDVNDKIYVFESLYNDILDEHAPWKQVHIRGNQVPYMNEKWRKAIRYRNRLWKQFIQDRNDSNYAIYKEQRNKCTSLRRQAIREFFLKKTETDNSRDFWHAYRPFLHSKKSKQANDIILEENGVVITDKKTIAEVFNSYFIQVVDEFQEINENDFGTDFRMHPSIKAIYENNDNITSFNFRLVNKTQVEKLLMDINVRKSCGHDLLPPRLIKESTFALSGPLTSILNSCICQCKYPMRWKKGQVTPLFKKDEELNKVNYRPITVLSCLNNIFERLLAGQLEDFCKSFLSEYISSYRRNFSCETALLRLTEDWRTSYDNKEIVAVVSMDLSKAFDSIPHALLLAKLKAYGISDNSCALLQDYLFGRMQRVKIGDQYSSWQVVARGIPQGSVLGPLFFNIFINDMFYQIKMVKLNAYADDEQLYDSDKDPIALEKRMLDGVNVANTWYHDNGMMVNPSKHEIMILGKTDHRFSFVTKDSIDLFGMTIDNKLKFDDYISKICRKINNQLNVMIRFRKMLSAPILLRLYKAFILPHFYYCSTVWHFCGSRNIDKLEALNKRILRFIYNDKDSSYCELLEKARMVSLFNKRIQSMLIILFKCLRFGGYPRYLKDIFTLRTVSYSLRGTDILSLPKCYTTTYGLHSFKYQAVKYWNSLPDDYRQTVDFNDFRNKIRNYQFS